MPEAKKNIAKIVTEIAQELSANEDYGPRIQKVQLTPRVVPDVGHGYIDIDVVADLSEPEDSRRLGEVLIAIKRRYWDLDEITIEFHQYRPKQYAH